MELSECLKGRRSVRAYMDMEVPRDVIERILEAGAWAPTGMDAQPVQFIVIEDRGLIGKLSERTKEILVNAEWTQAFRQRFESKEDTIFYNAPVLVLCCVELCEVMNLRLIEAGLCAQNMFLQAFDEGLGSCFIGFASCLNGDPLLAEAGVPDGFEVLAPLVFGYPAEEPEAKSREVKVIKWLD